VDPSAPDNWWAPFRRVGGAHVIHVDLTPHEARETAAGAWLDSGERARRRNFRIAAARRRFVLCRAALRALLCEHLGCENERLSFAAAKHGKPFALVDARPVPAAFNVTHGGQHGLIALAPSGRLGVDAEDYAPHRKLDDLVEAVLGPNEQAELAAVTGDDRTRLFFRLWTLKEAVTKALGTGLSLDVSRFEIPAPVRAGTTRCVLRVPDAPEVAWQLDSLCNERFAAAVAQEINATG
jgi:4'-phosphopantetheinyl transferase